MATTVATTAGIPHLKVSTEDTEPFVWRTLNADKTTTYHGYLKELLDEITDRAKMTYEFVQSDDGIGRKGYGGKWTGIIGDVIDGDADVGAAGITVTPDREGVVDFTKPFMKDSVNLLVYKPQWFDLGLGYLVRPFSGDYWIVLLVAFLLAGLMFFIIGKFSPYEWGNVAAEKDPRGARNAFSLRNSYLFVLTTLTWQGFREAPRSLSGRLMAAFWWLFVLFSLVAYSANLTAFFLSRPEMLPDMPFNTYEDLASSSEITTGAKAFGTTDLRMRSSRDSTIKGLSNKMTQQNSFVDSYKAGVERVKAAQGKFVMFMESSSAEYAARQNCNLMLYGEDLFPTNLAFVVKKTSVLKTKFNEIMIELASEGVLDNLRKKFWRFGGQGCTNVDGRDFLKNAGYMSKLPIYPLTLKDMAVAEIFFFLGIIAAIILLLVEILHYNVTKKGKKIHRPAVVKSAQAKAREAKDKIYKPKKGAAKPAPEDIEAGADESGPLAGPTSDDENMESVPLDYASDDAGQVLSDGEETVDETVADVEAAKDKVVA